MRSHLILHKIPSKQFVIFSVFDNWLRWHKRLGNFRGFDFCNFQYFFWNLTFFWYSLWKYLQFYFPRFQGATWKLFSQGFQIRDYFLTYRKVASSRLSRLVAHFWIFRLLMKGKFDAHVLWPLAQRV